MNIRVTVWGENVHEQKNRVVAETYPLTMHGTIAAALNAADGITATTVTLQDHDHGLTPARLATTDVLIWWGHAAHGDVQDAVVERVAMAARVESLGRALSASEDAARTDPMTGAGNRLRFVETMQRALALMTLSGTQASLLALDVDDLKGINDTLGHAAGDLAIKAVAKACWTVCTRPTDVLCRLGGDEFAVVMTNTDATAAASLADRLERRMQEVPVTLADGVVRLVTASIGFAAAKPGETVDAWIARADKSLYDVKHERG